jgi:hypothetical protein
VLLLLLCEDIVNPNGKIGLSSFIDNLLLHQSSNQRAKPTPKNINREGFKDQNHFLYCFFVVLRKFEIKYTHLLIEQ